MQIDGLSGIAVILIASFGIERIVTGLLLLLSLLKPWSRLVPDPASAEDAVGRSEAERKQKVAFFVFAGILGDLVLAYFGEVRIFRALGFINTNEILDSIMTGLILVAGADHIGPILKLSGAPGGEKPAERPIEITGRLILEGETGKKAAGVSGS